MSQYGSLGTYWAYLAKTIIPTWIHTHIDGEPLISKWVPSWIQFLCQETYAKKHLLAVVDNIESIFCKRIMNAFLFLVIVILMLLFENYSMVMSKHTTNSLNSMLAEQLTSY